MSKHQEFCCGCKFDDIDNICYMEACEDCELNRDGQPTLYEENCKHNPKLIW